MCLKKNLTVILSWTLFNLLFMSHAQAFFNWNASLDLIGGYRQDEIETLIKNPDCSHDYFTENNLKIKPLHILEIGLKGEISICNYLIKGFTSKGRIYSGKYIEKTFNSLRDKDFSKSNFYAGHTQDYSIGIGYLYPIFKCFCFSSLKIGPVAGWSYHLQCNKIDNINSNSFSNYILDNLKYKTIWQGPWLGIETYFSLLCITMKAGYEYHWSHWQAEKLGDEANYKVHLVQGRTKYGYGNVAFLDASISPFLCTQIGIELKYQYWKAKEGKEKFQANKFNKDRSLLASNKIPYAKWESVGIQLYLGCAF